MVGAGSLMQFVQGTLLLQAFGAYFAVLRDDRGWTKTELSGAAAMHQLEAAVLGPVLGWFLDRFGAAVGDPHRRDRVRQRLHAAEHDRFAARLLRRLHRHRARREPVRLLPAQRGADPLVREEARPRAVLDADRHGGGRPVRAAGRLGARHLRLARHRLRLGRRSSSSSACRCPSSSAAGRRTSAKWWTGSVCFRSRILDRAEQRKPTTARATSPRARRCARRRSGCSRSATASRCSS